MAFCRTVRPVAVRTGSYRKSGGSACPKSYRDANTQERDMRKFHSMAALCGYGLRPELEGTIPPAGDRFRTELFIRLDGMTHSGPDPVSEVTDVVHTRPKTACLICAGE